MPSYQFRLLRYAPTISGESYSVAVVLYDAGSRITDARFLAEFDDLRANPDVELLILEALRDEFEEQRSHLEGFQTYFEKLCRNLSNSLQVTDLMPFEGDEAAFEMDRLVATYLTPQRS